ncbi:flagellar filament core protein flaB2 domain protein [Leptospira brenneri]|uniref:Flagellar filament core protein flaB2 domain protein n=1 Tax=Leptospira brenneri TaxID=2023182 RepID=A0A5F1Z7J2_9LEPT|nr:flagellar filament core protein flaB2 domain protein [Leptospira brenneri]TGK95545.1 flagellar filament core protein flaB2 domain protein [Leptospira brenneri]
MKLKFKSLQSIGAERESVIQKQIQKIRKEISLWDFSSKNKEAREILLRTNVSSFSFCRVRVEKDSVVAIDSRLKFVSLTVNNLEKLYHSQPAKTTFQKQTFLIKKAIVYLDTLLAISKRIFEISELEIRKKTKGKDLQWELDLLIDEVDRIASLAEFRYLHLFGGDYAKSSRTASMWFINEKNGSLFRVYIATMTSKALGLRSLDGNYLTLSNSTLLQKKIEETILKIKEERKQLQSVLD